MPKVKAADWRNRDLEDWNVTTFGVWFAELCESRYGVMKYLPFRNWSAEKGMLKRFITEHGQAVTKEFLETCLKIYKPSGQYLHLTIGFAISYMQNPHLQKILMRKKAVEKVAAPQEVTNQSIADLEVWF